MESLSKNFRSKGKLHLGVLVLLGVLSLAVFYTKSHAPVANVISDFVTLPQEPVTLLFVGDIMFDRGVRNSITKNFGGDYNALFAAAPYLKDADITFGNLEGTVTEEFGPRTGSKFSFRMDPAGLDAMKDAGFDIVSFANNHVGDYSTKGFLETIKNLEAVNLPYAGGGENKSNVVTPTVIDVRGMKIGFLAATDVGPTWLAATDEKPGILLADDPDLSTIVSNAKAQVDVLVVSFHWGNEYSPVSARQSTIAHTVVDAGADIVVGHHPHVMQKMETYNGKIIFYSLGNFIFDQYFSEHTMRGMTANVTIDPETKEMTSELFASPITKQYVAGERTSFEESMLITKSFTP